MTKKTPTNWESKKIEEVILKINPGFACSKRFERKKERGIAHLRPNNIGYWGNLNLSKIVYISKRKIDKKKLGLESGDVLFNNTNSKELVGRASLVRKALNAGFSNHITRIKVDTKKILPKWVVFHFYKLWLDGYFLHICKKWIGQAGVDTTMLKKVKISYPSLGEQRRIADKIDKLFAEVDKGIEKTKESLERARNLLQSELNRVFGRDKKGWAKYRLEEVAEIIMGQSPPSSTYNKNSRGLPFFQGKADFSEIFPIARVYCDSPRKISLKNDVLISVRAPVGPVNMCGEKSCIGRGLSAIRPTKLSNYFLYYFFKYLEPKWKNQGRGAVFGSIGKADLISLRIPVPLKENKLNLKKQKEVAGRLNQIEEQSQELQRKYEEQLRNFEMLRQSILNQAFQGKL